jgi:hypothetical protein
MQPTPPWLAVTAPLPPLATSSERLYGLMCECQEPFRGTPVFGLPAATIPPPLTRARDGDLPVIFLGRWPPPPLFSPAVLSVLLLMLSVSSSADSSEN